MLCSRSNFVFSSSNSVHEATSTAADALRHNSNQRSSGIGGLICIQRQPAPASVRSFICISSSCEHLRLFAMASATTAFSNVSIRQQCTILQQQNIRSDSGSAACNNDGHQLLGSTSFIDSATTAAAASFQRRRCCHTSRIRSSSLSSFSVSGCAAVSSTMQRVDSAAPSASPAMQRQQRSFGCSF